MARSAAAALGLLVWLVSSLQAQDLDLVLYAGDPSKRTMIDGIDDPEEHDAFLVLKATEDPAAKRGLAEQFLQRYPRSWMVSFAHAMAAKACVALDDLPAALKHGRESLAILPENGLLLSVLANVQVHTGLLEEARRSASDALEYLGKFRRPSQYSETEWERIERDLKASAHYVLGRVAATRGMRSTGTERNRLLSAARESLVRSLDLNGSDGIAAYLFGIVAEELGNDIEARSAFAAATRIQSPVQAGAAEKLRAAYADGGPQAHGSFQNFEAAIPPLRPRGSKGPDPTGAVPESFASYAGSQACAECHRTIFDAWDQTGMARMFRNYEPANVFGDFEEANELRGPDGELVGRMLVEGGRHFFELPASGGMTRFPVDYTIGSKWQQAYATRLPDGRIHVIPVQYNRIHGKWVNFWEVLDDGPSERSIIENFHRMQPATSYQLHCASCHTSQVQAEGALVVPERITFRETGINCEMCHGPSSDHAAALRAGSSVPVSPGAPPLRFGDLDHRSYVRVCAQCHMQSSIVQPGAHGEINYSGQRLDFLNRREQRPYEEYSRGAFYKDGRFRETTFIVESFMRSKCFRDGEVHCGHCHDPHPADSATNPTSLKFTADPDRMCLQCHDSHAADVSAHTRHREGSEASRCATCHMPKIMNSMMFLARTHRIDDIPSPAMTERFGRVESPNACLACHEGETAAWLADSLANW